MNENTSNKIKISEFTPLKDEMGTPTSAKSTSATSGSRPSINQDTVVTPTRQTYETLASAHQAIAARKARQSPESPLHTPELPLPPIPIPVHDAPPKLPERLAGRVDITPPALFTTGRLLPTAFRGHSSGTWFANAEAKNSNNSLSSPHDIQPLSSMHNIGSSSSHLAQQTFSDGPQDDLETGRGNQPSSLRPFSSSSSHYYDEDYIFSDTSSHENSAPLPLVRPLFRSKSLVLEDLSGERDHSAGTIIDAYNYGPSQHSLNGVVAQRKAEFEATMTLSRPEPRALLADTAVAGIIRRYHLGLDLSSEAHSDAQYDLADVNDNPEHTSQMPAVPSPVHRMSSGLSELDIGWSPIGNRKGRVSTRSLIDPFEDPDVEEANTRLPSHWQRENHRDDWRYSVEVLPRRDVVAESQSQRSSVGSPRDLLLITPPRARNQASPPEGLYTLDNSSLIASSTALPGPRSMRMPVSRPDSDGFSDSDGLSRSGSIPQIQSRNVSHVRSAGVSGIGGSTFMFHDESNAEPLSSSNTNEDPTSIFEIECAPVPAFTHNQVISTSSSQERLLGLNTGSNPDMQLSPSPVYSVASDFGTESEADNQDWETVADSKRTLQTNKTIDSWADMTASDSLSVFRSTDTHPPNSQYQHNYRVHTSSTSDHSILVPAYEFRDGAKFPNKNALAPPTPVQHSIYKSSAAEDGFASASTPKEPPVAITPFEEFLTSSSEPPPIPKKAPRHKYAIRQPSLSVVFEHSDELTMPKSTKPHLDAKAPNSFQNVTSTSSVWLDTEPGPSITNGSELADDASYHGPSAEEKGKMRERLPILNSGVNVALLHDHKNIGESVTSSPLSAANSFAKMTMLGPRANLTGTPQGTGMQQTGSSVVGSSPFLDSNSIREPMPQRIRAISSQIGIPSSPIQVTHGSWHKQLQTSHFSSSTQSSGFSPERILSNLTDNFREQMLAASRADSEERARVTGQTELRELALPMQVELMEIDDRASPRLTSPSSTSPRTRRRMNRISWLVFAGCCLFPPLLIIYSHGFLDPIVASATDGEITRFGRRHKRVARVVGYGATMFIIVGITIALVVINRSPNDLPR